MNFGRNILQVNKHRLKEMTLYFQDGGHDVISRIKVLTSGECTRLCPPGGRCCLCSPLAILSLYSSWSIVHSYSYWNTHITIAMGHIPSEFWAGRA